MNISLNILLDRIAEFPQEAHIPLPSDRKYRDVRMYKGEVEDLSDDILYVLMLSQVPPLEKRGDHIFVCLRDTQLPENALQNLILTDAKDLNTVFSALQDVFYQIGAWYQSSLEAIIQNRSFQDIIDLSEGILQNYVQITDSSFKLLGYTRHIECDEEITVLARKYGYHPDSTIRKFEKYRRFEAWDLARDFLINDNLDLCRYPIISKIFRFSNTYFSHAVMVCNNVPLTQGTIDLFKLFIDLIVVFVEKDWESTRDYHNVYDAFLKDLYVGTLTRRDIIEERSRHVGIPADGCFCLSVTSADEGGAKPPGIIAKELSRIRPDDKIVILDGRLIILSLLNPKKARAQYEELQKELDPVMEKYDLRCGISDIFYSLPEVSVFLKQAFQALSCSGRTPGSRLLPFVEGAVNGLEKRVVSFNESFSHILLGSSPANREIWKESVFCRTLKMLDDYDRQHGMNNLHLLFVYLNCESRPAEAGNILHMSRNNVAYRIDRIEQMIGMDLKIPAVKTGLKISYIMLQLYGFD